MVEQTAVNTLMVSSVLGYTVNNLPSVDFHDRHLLPDQSGVYFLRAGSDPVVYVGQAKSLFKRWRSYGHEKSRIVEYMMRQNPEVQYRLHFLCVPTADLDRVEKEAIKALSPEWNNRSRGESTASSLLEIERRVSGLEVSMVALAYGQSAAAGTPDAYENQMPVEQTTLFEQLGIPSGEFTPSPQQKAIFDWVQHGSGDAVVIACAGSGKTTTLVQACRLMRGSIRLLAFNKSIKAELTKRLKKAGVAAEVFTLNGYGHSLCQKYKGGGKDSINLNTSKYSNILDELRQEHYKTWVRSGGRPYADESMPGHHLFSIEVLHKCQTQCFSPDGSFAEYESVMRKFGYDVLEDQFKVVKKALSLGVDRFAKTGEMDYSDQIWLPYVLGMADVGVDFTCVDECQDLSPAQLNLALKCRGNGRSLWVGDPNQAIYFFNGATSDSVEKIKSTVGAVEFPLSVSYRCAKMIVEKAKESGSIIEAHPNSPKGIVKEAQVDIDKVHLLLSPGDLVICRRWVSLFCVFLHCRERGQRVFFVGDKAKKVIKNMISIVDGFVKDGVAFELLKQKLDALVEEVKLFQGDSRSPYARQQINVLCALVKFYEMYTPGSYESLKTMIVDKFGDRKSGKYVSLSSTFGAKGLEADRVFVLDWDGFDFSHLRNGAKSESVKQRENVSYVAVTRAKTQLHLLTVDYATRPYLNYSVEDDDW